MAGVQELTKEQREYINAAYLRGDVDIKDTLVAQGVDGDWWDTISGPFMFEAMKQRAYADTVSGSLEYWAQVAWNQITPAPAGCLQTTFDTEGGEEIIIVGSMFSPGCTATIGGEDITILAMSNGSIYGLTPPVAAGETNDIVVTSANDNAGTLTPGPATAVKTPVFTSITPATGPAAGGSRHILVGTGFTPGVAVTIGGHAAGVERQNETTLVITPAAHAAGALDIVITNTNEETVTEASGFTYV